MKKKSPGSEELPLFDLPLRESPEAPRPQRSAAAKAAPPRAAERRPAAPAYDEQLQLAELDEIAEAAPGVAARATIGDRFFAGLADLLLHALVVGLASLAVLLIGHPVGWRELPPFVAFGLLFSFLYSVFSLAFWGQTPGMAWAGHLARSVTGEPLTFGQTVLRWLGGLLTLALAGLPLLLALAGGRSLSDRISDSKTQQL
jgi:uncharacterized RDD family membrane protein YckC